MPTGYTAPIHEGQILTGDQFIFRCARAVGAVGMAQRDAPLDAPLTFTKRDTTSAERDIERAQAEVDKYAAMTLEEAATFARAEHAESVKRQEEAQARAAVYRGRYEPVIAQVEAWVPPTPQHGNIKDFALSQLRGDLEHYGTAYDYTISLPDTAEEWLSARRNRYAGNLKRAQDHLVEIRKNNEDDEAWVTALVGSLNLPAPASV